MNNTPETDHLEETDQHRVDVLAEHAACRRCLEHARQLERERDEARECLERCSRAHCKLGSRLRSRIVYFENQRDKWEETARLYCQNSDYHQEMREKAERERDEAREQRDGCQLELQIVTERLKGNRHPDDNGMKYEGEIDVEAIIEQRDRLAEACRLLMAIVGPLEKKPWATDNQINRAYNAGKQALATNFPQTPAK